MTVFNRALKVNLTVEPALAQFVVTVIGVFACAKVPVRAVLTPSAMRHVEPAVFVLNLILLRRVLAGKVKLRLVTFFEK
jgi:hypothetical protein